MEIMDLKFHRRKIKDTFLSFMSKSLLSVISIGCLIILIITFDQFYQQNYTSILITTNNHNERIGENLLIFSILIIFLFALKYHIKRGDSYILINIAIGIVSLSFIEYILMKSILINGVVDIPFTHHYEVLVILYTFLFISILTTIKILNGLRF